MNHHSRKPIENRISIFEEIKISKSKAIEISKSRNSEKEKIKYLLKN